MPKLLQINSTANWGSTGRIAEQIGERAIAAGWESYIAYGRKAQPSKSQLIKIGSRIGVLWHVLISRLFDLHGLASRIATKRLIKKIKAINPDIIHLHNIHGYYLNYRMLFEYLQTISTPIVWTLHDCWSFTGHCAHYVKFNSECEQWQSGCESCKCYTSYPKSLTVRSRGNYRLKKTLFLSIGKRLTLVSVSQWLATQAQMSFFSKSNICYIYNGINTNVFTPIDVPNIIAKYNLRNKFVIISVASTWTEAKGLSDFVQLREKLSEKYVIMLVGVTSAQKKNLPKGIIGICRTQSQQELAELYSASDVVVSLSRAETFGLTIAEGMACGVPAIVYNRTAIPELVTEETGRIVGTVGDIGGVVTAIREIEANGKAHYAEACRKYAEQHFDKDKCFEQYIGLYNEIINNTK